MNTIDLTGRVALITGAARGIGEDIARDFHKRGAKVLITDILDDLGAGVASDIGDGAAFQHLDVVDERQWTDAFAACEAQFGKADILINNAGIEVTTLLPGAELEAVRKMFEINVLGTMLGMKHGMNTMSQANGGKGGAILNMSSMAAVNAIPGFGPYGATKAAVERLTKVAAVESGALGAGVRVNCVYPGIIETAMQDKLGADLIEMGLFPDAEAIGEYVMSKTPLRRTGKPLDVAQAAAYLCSDFAEFITGVGLPVDGGMSIG